jgi:hypothetical protein
MIISRRDGQLVLVDQVEHARLCGTFAKHWGNAGFATVSPAGPVRAAAEIHDDGWRESDRQPLYNAEERRPLAFLELDRAAHVRLYATGVEQAYRRSPYAGLLVSMHWTGLYRSRWGMPSGRVPPTPPAPEDAVIDREEQRWSKVKHQLLENQRRSDLEIGLWHNFDLLQAWDLLSLFACLMDLAPVEGGATRPVASTLANIDQEPGPRTIPSVPLAAAGERVEITLTALEPGVVKVDPYPFDVDGLSCSVAARAMPDRPYENEADSTSAFRAAEPAAIEFRLVT